VDPLVDLRRSWWFAELRGYRSAEPGTYARYDLDDQPPVPDLTDLGWLEAVSDAIEWPIDNTDATPSTRLTTHELNSMAVPVRLPGSLTTLAARADFRGRIRSATACYLDLGDHVAVTANGGHLLHVLSDQQWVRHWLLYIDAEGYEAVLTSTAPIGFELPPEDAHLVPEVIPVDGSFDLELCADTLAEFLFRFWIENELWWAIQDGGELPQHLVTYAQLLSRVGADPF
jgi:hypothetical protein